MDDDGEIIGLYLRDNGRSCESHDCCGNHLSQDDLIRFKLTIITKNGKPTRVLKAVCIRDGTESCTVGFMSGKYALQGTEIFRNKFTQVIELYEESEDPVKQKINIERNGVASFRMLDDIMLLE